MKSMKAKDVISKITEYLIVFLVLLVCSLIGIMGIVSALDSIFSGPFAWGDFIAKVLVGFLFGGIASIFLYFYFLRHAVSGWINTYRQNRYGDKPWLLKRAWRKGKITYRAPSPVVFFWIWSMGWNGGLGVVLVANRAMILEAIRENWLNAPMLLLFILVGLGVLYAAIHMTLAKKVAGWALFTMESVPGVIGGKLRGSIQTRIPVDFKKAVTLKLAGTSSVPFKKAVPRERMQEASKGLILPVDFDIPDSCEGTNIWDPERKVEWTLSAMADLDKGDWEVKFAVPVFKVGNPDA